MLSRLSVDREFDRQTDRWTH